LSVQVSYKKQLTLILFLVISLLVLVEVLINVWLYNFYSCDFEDAEIFKDIDPETKKKICHDSIGNTFANQKFAWASGTDSWMGENLNENIVYINSEGFRGQEFIKAKPINTFRIFTSGGSTTFGIGVFNNQTYPLYLQELFDSINTGFNVEVINIGWPKFWSVEETKMIKEKFLDYEPDLFIVLTGWNDMTMQAYGAADTDAKKWKERWAEICELGKKHHFDTVIALQPSVGTGKKILSQQETEYMLGQHYQQRLELYPSYVEQLKELKNHCSLSADLRNIFDHISEPIYYDFIHVGKKGNYIIAEKLYRLTLPIVLGSERIEFNENNKPSSFEGKDLQLISNDLDLFREEIFMELRGMVSLYKTPRIFTLIFE